MCGVEDQEPSPRLGFRSREKGVVVQWIEDRSAVLSRAKAGTQNGRTGYH